MEDGHAPPVDASATPPGALEIKKFQSETMRESAIRYNVIQPQSPVAGCLGEQKGDSVLKPNGQKSEYQKSAYPRQFQKDEDSKISIIISVITEPYGLQQWGTYAAGKQDEG